MSNVIEYRYMFEWIVICALAGLLARKLVMSKNQEEG